VHEYWQAACTFSAEDARSRTIVNAVQNREDSARSIYFTVRWLGICGMGVSFRRVRRSLADYSGLLGRSSQYRGGVVAPE
jgi:hypothetical protein